MAITKLLRLKECSRGNKAQHLKNNIRYILNPEKTQGGLNIGGNAGMTWDWVYDTMVENKRYWHKEDGSQGFHYVISFPPEADVSIQTAHEVAQEFCSELLGENYYYVYAIHDDKPHLHIHVTFDSVSRLTGLKYHSPHGDWEKRIQPITAAVCKKFGLPPLTYGEERVGAPYETWRENKERQNGGKTDPNRVSWTDIIRDDIDEAVRNSDSFASFLSYLQAMHYQVRDGKYLSLKPYGKPKAVRTRSLGPGYGREELIARINAFWRISQVKILPAYKAAFFQDRFDDVSCRTRICRAFQHDELPFFQVRSNQLRRSFHIIQIRTRIIIQRRRHADDDGIRFTD